jgi:hypothetical protein
MSIEIPSDQFGRPLYNITPRGTALARTVQALTSSFKVELNASTRFLRVYAIAKDVYLHWAESDTDYATSANFDEVIPAGQFIDLYVPLKWDGSTYELIQLVGRESGATVVVIEK